LKNRISAKLADRLPPQERPYEVRDDLLKGFILRIQPSGIKSYICEYARGKRETIGRTNVISAVQARDLAKDILAAYQINGTVTPNRQLSIPTLASFINDEYRPWQQANNKRGDEEIDRIRKQFLPKLGKKPLNEITPHAVEHWRTKRLESGIKPSTVNRQLASLKAALSKAVTWGLISEHPLANLKLLKVDNNPNPRFLTDDEETTLRDTLDTREKEYRLKRESANKWRQERGYNLMKNISTDEYYDHLKPAVLLTLNTGLRIGELFSLRWSDIDLDNQNLTVAGSYSKSGKTRQIPLNDEAAEVLQQWGSQSGQKSGLVFTGKSGDKLTDIKKSWRAVLQDAGIKSFRWHDLRHNFASKLVMASVDLNTVRELLGHSTITMTLRYAHLAPEHMADAVAKIAYGKTNKSNVIPFTQKG
jgi:integrase